MIIILYFKSCVFNFKMFSHLKFKFKLNAQGSFTLVYIEKYILF